MNKSYGNEHEEDLSRVAYEHNCRLINEHNEAAENGKFAMKVRPNHMSDLTQSEYARRFLRLLPSDQPNEDQSAFDVELGSVFRGNVDEHIPDSLGRLKN